MKLVLTSKVPENYKPLVEFRSGVLTKDMMVYGLGYDSESEETIIIFEPFEKNDSPHS